MESPFAKSSTVKPRLKMLVWGASGSGKTTTGLAFPKPVLIDMEEGSLHYGDSFDFGVLHANDIEKIREAIGFLKFEKHEYKTLVLDPITVIWEALIVKWSKIFLQKNPTAKANKGEFYDLQPGDWQYIKAEYNEILVDMISLDMNVIVTAREKTQYKDGEFMQVSGKTFGGEKNTDYKFDTVLRLFEDSGKHKAVKIKDRSNKLPDDPFELSYEVLEKAFGKEALDRKVVPVVYAKKTQKDKIEKLVRELDIKSTTLTTRLKEYGATCLHDLSELNANVIIEKLEAAAKEKKNAGSEPKSA